jgi:hypothetical protein
MMDSGMGKDQIYEFCSQLLSDHDQLFGTNALTFLGPATYTGPKGLLDELSLRPCFAAITSEAGFIYQTLSGNQAGLTAKLLQLYNRSGRNSTVPADRYSDNQNSTKTLTAPALTLFNEATPESLQGELRKRKSIRTGELPRMWVFKLDGNKPYDNLNHGKIIFPTGFTDFFRKYLAQGMKAQVVDVRPEVIEIPLWSGYQELSNYHTDEHNRLKHTDPSMSLMHTRAAHKQLRVGALCAALDNPEKPKITKSHMEYAQQLHKLEFSLLPKLFNTDSIAIKAQQMAMRKIAQLLNGELKAKNKYIAPALREKGMFPASPFKQLVGDTNEDLNAFAQHYKKGTTPPWQLILDYLVAQGFLVQIKNPPSTGRGAPPKQVYQATQEFSDYFNENIRV